jgi:hypothetical protein
MEIEEAAAALSLRGKKTLLRFLASHMEEGEASRRNRRRKLKAASRPALEGLPAGLSVGTRERVRALVRSRHATDR